MHRLSGPMRCALVAASASRHTAWRAIAHGLPTRAARYGPCASAATVLLANGAGLGPSASAAPPAHIALLRTAGRRRARRGWTDDEFESAIAACNLLPGPASTQLAIFCAYRVAGRRGALVGGLAFIVPAVICVLLLSLLFLAVRTTTVDPRRRGRRRGGGRSGRSRGRVGTAATELARRAHGVGVA